MHKSISLVVIALLWMSQSLFAQDGKICHWANDKKAAVVITFDDWTVGQFPIAVQELKKRNIHATFFIMLRPDEKPQQFWPNIIKTASYGNEIANHTQTHPNLTKVSAEQLSKEIRGMQDTLEKHVPSQKVVSFAYPYGTYNEAVIDTLKSTGHIAARSVVPSSENYTYQFAPNENDYFKILTYGMNGKRTTAEFFQQIKNVIQGGGLLTYLYHSVDDAKGTYHDNWYATVLQDSLCAQLDTLLSVKKQVWITTFEKAIKYHKEAGCAMLTEISPFDGKRCVINLTDTLSNHSVYNQPLTIKLKTNGVHYTAIRQHKKQLKIKSAGNDSIMFCAVPNEGPITLTSNRK